MYEKRNTLRGNDRILLDYAPLHTGVRFHLLSAAVAGRARRAGFL